jgi:hypothetical protein
MLMFMVIIGCHADIIIESHIMERSFASPGTGSVRMKRRNAASLHDNSKKSK